MCADALIQPVSDTLAPTGPGAPALPAAPDPGALALGVRPVAKAYEQVAQQLRASIVAGRIRDGERLPSESALASAFGVSRATVREALRLLAAESLVRTENGAAGGSYVTLPTAQNISRFLRDSLGILATAEHVTLTEILEVRELLEIPAARIAAERRTTGSVARLRAAIPARDAELTRERDFAHNADFHTAVIEASGNLLLGIAAQPIFDVLQSHLFDRAEPNGFRAEIRDQHDVIAAAIAAGHPRQAEQAMRDHLAFLRPHYERIWRHAVELHDQKRRTR